MNQAHQIWSLFLSMSNIHYFSDRLKLWHGMIRFISDVFSISSVAHNYLFYYNVDRGEVFLFQRWSH